MKAKKKSKRTKPKQEQEVLVCQFTFTLPKRIKKWVWNEGESNIEIDECQTGIPAVDKKLKRKKKGGSK